MVGVVARFCNVGDFCELDVVDVGGFLAGMLQWTVLELQVAEDFMLESLLTVRKNCFEDA